MKKILTLYICLIHCLASMNGQSHDFHLFNRQDGFPLTEMLSVVRDASGRMWFSSSIGGLIYSDGKGFYTFSDTSSRSMLDYWISLRTAHNDSTIVILNGEKGLSLIRDGKIKNYSVQEHPLLFGASFPNSGFQDGRIWGVNGKGQVFQFDAQTDGFIEIAHLSFGDFRIGEVDYHPDSKTYYFLIRLGNIEKIVKGQINGEWTIILQEDTRINPIKRLSCSLSGYPIVCYNDNIRYYEDQKWQDIPLSVDYKNKIDPVTLLLQRRDRFFLVLKIDEKRRQVYELDQDFKILSSVILANRSRFTSIEKDLAGNFWVATRDGQYKVTPSFFNFFSREDEGMITDLHAIAEEPNGHIWFGSYTEGLSMFDGVKLLKKPKGTDPLWRFMPGSLRHNGQILMNIENDLGGIYAFDGKTWKRNLKGVAIFYSTKLVDGRLAFGGSGGRGVALQNVKGNRFQDSTDFHWVNGSKGMKLVNVLSIAEDRLGHIWLGRSSQGLAVYDPHLDTAFTWLIQNPQTDFGAMAITSDDKGNVWFGTKKGVFFYKTPQNHSVTTLNYWKEFNPFKSLVPIGTGILDKSSEILSLKIWRNKYLIVGMSNGFSVVDIQQFYASEGKRFPIFKFDEKNGFSGGGTEQNALWIDKNDNIWIGHDKGATRFDIKNFPFDTVLPPLSIDSLCGGKMTYFPKLGERITLHSGEQDVKIYLNMPMNPYLTNDVWIKYRLVGQTDWSELSNIDVIALPSLQPDIYTLEIVAVKNGLEAPPQYLTFRINKIWFKSQWFWVSFILTLGGIGFLIYREQEQRKRLFGQLRVQAIANQLNPHFINNTLNMIQLKSRNNADAVDMIDLLSQNIQTIFKNTRNKKSYHTLAEEIHLVQNYLKIQKYRFKDQIDFELPNDKKIMQLNNLCLPLMSLQIHCENAVEHGIRNQKREGKVSVRIESNTDKYVHIIVEDNGIGREKARLINSKGNQQGVKMLVEMAEITNRFNADKISYRYEDGIFTDEAGLHFGTRVHLFIPITYNYEPPE